MSNSPDTKFKGRGVVMITGRNPGKSHVAAYQRLYQDLLVKPLEAMLFDQGTVYGARYHTVEPVGGNWLDMETWCLATFGPAGDRDKIWGELRAPEPAQRWYVNNRKFWFRDLKDRDWFVIRWNS